MEGSTGLTHSCGLTLDLECPEGFLLRQLPSLAQKTSFREPNYFVKDLNVLGIYLLLGGT